MSIIQEALKKVQKDTELKVPQPQKPAEAPAVVLIAAPVNAPAPAVPSSSDKTFQKYSPYILAFLVILGASAAYMMLRQGQAATRPNSGSIAIKDQRPPSAVVSFDAPQTGPRAAAAGNRTDFAPIELIRDVASLPFGGKPVLSQNLVLNGIMYLEDGPQAIINNSIVMEGDNVEGAVVRKINRKSVVLSSGGSDFTLDLK